MRYHLFQKFFGKMVKIKETSFSASDVIPHDRTRIPIFAQRAISTAAQAFPLQPRSFSTAAQAFPPQPRSISTAAQEPGI